MSGLSLHAIRYPSRHGDPRRVSPKIVHLVAAARPNFMKVAPLYHELARGSWCTARIVHTGQHYDANMSDAFFRDLRLPEPAHHLEVGSGSHAEQTGRTMIAYEGVCQRERPGAIVVVGDVNATAACALVGAKLWLPVVHLAERAAASLRRRICLATHEIAPAVTGTAPRSARCAISRGPRASRRSASKAPRSSRASAARCRAIRRSAARAARCWSRAG